MFEAGSPVFVAVHDDEIIGWAAYFQFVTPAIYYGTVEDSVYIAPSAQGKGVGSELLDALMDYAADDSYVQTMITYIVDTNEGSIALHKKPRPGTPPARFPALTARFFPAAPRPSALEHTNSRVMPLTS